MDSRNYRITSFSVNRPVTVVMMFFAIIVVSIISFVKVRFWLLRRSSEKSKSRFCSVDRSNGTMIRKLIHEIRNPLNSMSLHLQLLAEDLEIQIPSDHTSDLTRVQRIQDEIQRLDQLLSSFQRYANLPPLQFEVVDLKRVINKHCEAIHLAVHTRIENQIQGD